MLNLKKLRIEKQLSQKEIAEYLGISQPAYANYERGVREADYSTLTRLSELFGVSIDEILGISHKLPEAVKIPVLGKVQAGFPIEAVENIIDYEEITKEMAAQGEYFALQIKGDSMEPRFTEGDVVIVRKQSIVDNGDIAIILVNGDEATIKKFYKDDEGITLKPNNPAYPALVYSAQQVNDLPVTVCGKVVELRRSL